MPKSNKITNIKLLHDRDFHLWTEEIKKAIAETKNVIIIDSSRNLSFTNNRSSVIIRANTCQESISLLDLE